jgi:hypothetical protein
MQNPYLSGPTNTFASAQDQDREGGYRPVPPEYQPTSPVYTPLSPTYQPDTLDDGTDVAMSTGMGMGMGPPRMDPFGRTIPSTAIPAGVARTGGIEGVGGMLGPVIPEDARNHSTAAGGRGVGAGAGGKRLPNYAGLASPSPSPPAGRRLPQSQFNPTSTSYQHHHHQQQQQQRAVPPRAGPTQSSRRDPTYDSTASGVYPSMGMSGFTSGVEMNREVAVSRAVNAQWWAGYWFAMSEVSHRRGWVREWSCCSSWS